MNFNNYLNELKRRNVIKSGIAYLVVAWVLLQVFSILLPLFEAPLWVLRTITLLMGVGFPLWLVFSWIYEVTPEGIKKTKQVKEEKSELAKTGGRLNKLIIVFLAIAIVLIAESLNTAIEKLADFIHPEHHKQIGRIKDISAGAAFFAAIFAVIIGFIIYIPKFL